MAAGRFHKLANLNMRALSLILDEFRAARDPIIETYRRVICMFSGPVDYT